MTTPNPTPLPPPNPTPQHRLRPGMSPRVAALITLACVAVGLAFALAGQL
jgi:hypothetical protein